MKKNIKKIGIYFVISLSLVSLAACGKNEEDKKANKKESHKKVSVEVQTVEATSFTDFIETVGVVKPIEKANISYPEGGIIDRIENDKGSFVKKDDILFVIENDILKANLDAAEAQYNLAQMTFEKQEEIYKDNVNSEYQFLQSKYLRDQAKAAYDLAKTRYEKSFVKSPISGYVDSRNFDVGELAPPGITVMTVINTSMIKVVTGVPERYVGDVVVGKKAFLEFPELKDKKLYGKVSFVSNSVTTNNRTFDVEIIMKNPNRLIKPEMIVNVKIERKTIDDVFIIPDDALIRADDNYVLFIAKDGKAIRRDVEIISRFGSQVAIGSGLNNGEKLIVVGQQNLLEGTDIQIVN